MAKLSRNDECLAQTHEAPSPPGGWALFRLWLGIGAQSFGGGTATQYLIYQAFVERRGWLNPQEFARSFSVCQLTPGINLLALTILLGWRMRGPAGVVVSLAGLLLPSVTITVLMTAAYTGVRDLPLVRAALRGVVPATVGLGLLMSWQIAKPLLGASRSKGKDSLVLDLMLLVASGLVVAVSSPPIVIVLLAGGAVAGTYAWLRSGSSDRTEAG